MCPATYILPLKWDDDAGLTDLTAYLRDLSDHLDVIVVDGSPPGVFAQHAHAWRGLVEHVAVGGFDCRNGKVAGVLTGLDRTSRERVIIADDDVRYTRAALEAVLEALAEADLVKPQNHFAPTCWHARWDTARSLINRALGADYPGTYALRRSLITAAGGYDGDVLFENLELERTVRAAGGRVASRPDIFVARRPPSASQFLSQRVRQAYDSLAQPPRFAAELAILPAIALATFRRRWSPLIGTGAAAVLLAEAGRRRHGGAAHFPPTAALWAPAWLLERAVAAWVAAACRLTGGVPYSGKRLRRAATPLRLLRARLASVTAGSPARTPAELQAAFQKS